MSDSSSPFAYGGYLVGALTIIIAWLRDRRKNDVDESTLVMNKWKELVAEHKEDIKGIREEFALYKTTAMAEIGDLRTRLREAEKRITELETENTGLKRTNAERITKLEEENAGFRRTIIQNSKSTAQLIGANTSRLDRLTEADAEMVAKMDQAGHNLLQDSQPQE